MKHIRERLRDWWRGYSDADVRSLNAKWLDGLMLRPGSIIPLTRAEHKALVAGEINALRSDTLYCSTVGDPSKW